METFLWFFFLSRYFKVRNKKTSQKLENDASNLKVKDNKHSNIPHTFALKFPPLQYRDYLFIFHTFFEKFSMIQLSSQECLSLSLPTPYGDLTQDFKLIL